MDVRGYGGSSNPPEIEAYRLSELCGDAAAVIDELGDGEAIVFGHDWGAPIAWNTARLHADKVSAVAGLSVPYTPVGPVSSLELWRERYEGKFFYQLYIEQPGVVEAEVGADTAKRAPDDLLRQRAATPTGRCSARRVRTTACSTG